MTQTAAIILAAGLSSRMGRFKPLLPLGETTVLEQCVEIFRANGVEHILVVTGNRGKEVAAVAKQCGATPVDNPDYEQGMYSSVLAGVRALDKDVEAFFMLPVDIPLVRPETVTRLLKAHADARPDILYPKFNGDRGHPPLISRELIPAILAHDGAGGLRTVLDNHEPHAIDLGVADFGTVHDLDHPKDYELAQARFDAGFPDDAECDQLWRIYDTPLNVISHCLAVAAVGEGLCARLNEREGAPPLDTRLVRGAALTHDIGKGTHRHEQAGAERLHEHGFHTAAQIALEHFDISLAPNEPITEKEVVFLADKLVQGTSPTAMRSRYMDKLKLYAHEPGAAEAILGRLERASVILTRFDMAMNFPAEDIAREVLK